MLTAQPAVTRSSYSYSDAGERAGRRLASAVLLCLCLGTAAEPGWGGTPPPSPPAITAGQTNDITLRRFLQLVLERNESLHARVLEFEINQKRFQAERGIFEPELVLGYDRVENKRENTAEQRRSSGVLVFEEENNIYNSGIEALVPSGARVRLGYSLRELRNNLQDPPIGSIVTNTTGSEFQSFAGISLTQPLLKNGWNNATLANIRLAALGSDVAYQEYRRQMMLIISTAEASYWNLFMAQEQVRFFRDSVRLARTLVMDNQTRVQAGKAAELEVLEAMAGLALRDSKLAEAEQKYYETTAQLLTLISLASPGSTPTLQALDEPGLSVDVPAFAQSGQAALDLNPDYLTQLKRVKQEDIRVAYAKNQRLPQLDLKASYGLNGLGSDPAASWDDIEHAEFPSWSAGVELRLPLGGGIKARRELEAARLRKQQALVTLKETEIQILNAVETALRKVHSAAASAGNYQSVVTFNESLLATEVARLEEGKVSSRRVLEVDAILFEARNAVVEAKVQYERARLELELVQGTLLHSRNIDLTQKELERRTGALLRSVGITDRHLESLTSELGHSYRKGPPPPIPGPSTSSGQAPQPRTGSTPTSQDYERALRLLRDTMREAEKTTPPPK